MTSPAVRYRPTVTATAERLLLVVVAYVPFLLSSRGSLASDSKQGLYVDPAGFLADAAHLWDPSVGLGTVPHQHLGYLWPMGPWFWLFDAIGVPDWIAQRLWLGSLTLAAALGARWLVRSLGFGRAAGLVAALVYALTPYQLAFTARTSVLLLPWAGLPWLVEIARRAVHRGGWRHPAIFGLVTFTVAGVNAATLLLVGVAPLAVLVAAAVGGRWRPALATALRIGAVTLPVCAWWIAGLRVQAAHGIDILAVTEDLRTVAARSTPDDVLRGLGNWFFYGGDRAGPALVQAPYYDTSRWAVAASYLVPVLALAAAAAVRWRGRGLAIAMICSAVVAIGAWPYDDPSLFGRAFRWFAERSSAGMAFRNSPRIVPVLVLGFALVLAAAVAAAPARARRGAAAVVVLAALAGLAPVARTGMLSPPVERPEDLPAYWEAAAEHLDARGAATRVLELPGANFAAHRWGNAIEPITPLLADRPYVAREVLPQGSAESALLVDALDRRLQNGVLDPASIAPVARLLGVGDVVVRSDLAYERFDLPSPDTVWSTVVEPLAPDLGTPEAFGTPTANVAGGPLDPLLPSDLRPGTLERTTPLPPVVVLPVGDPVPILRLAAADGAIVLDGDADGIVDAAAAGVLDGRTLVLTSGALDDEQMAEALAGEPRLVLTDSNRRRIQTWFSSIRDTRGPTEQAGEVIVEPTGHDARLPSFPDATDDQRTVVEQLGATVEATSSGGAARPEDRPAAALDGRLDTSWRLGGADPTGNHLTIELEQEREIDRITLVQPQDGPRDRVLTRVRLRVGDGEPFDVDLDERSLDAGGQEITFPARRATTVDIELLATTTPGFDPALANAVGLAEVRIDDLVVTETVRMPLDLLRRAGTGSSALALDIVMTRLRSAADAWTRADDERHLDRTFDLPVGRSFGLLGTTRLSDSASDDLLDEVLGTTGTTTVTASSRLQGAPEARASRAFDGDPGSAWTAAFGSGDGTWIDLTGEAPAAIDRVRLDIVADGRHSVPVRVSIVADGHVVARHDLDPIVDGDVPGAVTPVTVPLDAPVSARQVRIVIDAVDPRWSPGAEPAGAPLPVSIAEVGGVGFDPLPSSGDLDRTCRTDLVTVDDQPVAVRLVDRSTDDVLSLAGCADVALAAGSHRVRTTFGEETGLDVDELTWRSGPGGEPVDPTGSGASDASGDPASTPAPGADLVSSSAGRTGVDATVETDGDPFWLVLGQSANAGWKLSVDGATTGPRTVVDGYANGWLITPDQAGTLDVQLRWTPQRGVVVAMGISAVAILVAAAVVVLTRHDDGPAPALVRPRIVGLESRPSQPSDLQTTGSSAWADAVLAGAVTGVLVAATSRWWIGLASGLAAAVVARRSTAALAIGVLSPAALLVARWQERHELGWLALGLLLAAVVPDLLRNRRRRRAAPG